MFKNCTTLLGIEAECGTVSIIWTSGMRSNSHEARKDPAWLEGSLSLLLTFEGIYTLFTLSLLSILQGGGKKFTLRTGSESELV